MRRPFLCHIQILFNTTHTHTHIHEFTKSILSQTRRHDHDTHNTINVFRTSSRTQTSDTRAPIEQKRADWLVHSGTTRMSSDRKLSCLCGRCAEDNG